VIPRVEMQARPVIDDNLIIRETVCSGRASLDAVAPQRELGLGELSESVHHGLGARRFAVIDAVPRLRKVGVGC